MKRLLRPILFAAAVMTPAGRSPDAADARLAGQPAAGRAARAAGHAAASGHAAGCGRARRARTRRPAAAGDGSDGYAAADSPAAMVRGNRHRQEGRGLARRLPEVPHEVVRGARRQQGRQALARRVPQGRRAADVRRTCRADPTSRSGAPAPRSSSRTSTPTATASSSAPRPRRWSIPSSTSTTRTATTR